MSGTLTIHHTYYLQADVHDGDYPHDDVETDAFVGIDLYEAIDRLRHLGLRFDATGGSWAADPDGSYTVDYGIGRECETSGHLDGFSPHEAALIAEYVDAR